MKAAINIQAWQAQDKEDRRADTQELRQLLERSLVNENTIIRTLQLGQDQLIDAMQALHRRMEEFTVGTVERRFAETGLAVLQRASGSKPGKRPDWEISAFDLDWDETPIDSGGFGTVHRGLWGKTEVAIKFLPAETRMEVLRNEVGIWRKLNHPHIHRFLKCSIVSNPPLIVSELCANGNAVNFLKKRPYTNRPRLVFQIAEGMRYLHSEGVLHGDLKASNVLIDQGGNALITDFGLSSIYLDISSQSRRTVVLSTAAERWKPPEALQGGQLTPKVDVYAWSMTAYEIFTGKVPFGHVFDVFTHVVTRRQTLTRPSSVEAPSLTDDLWAVMHTASAWEPGARPLFATIVQTLAPLKRTPSPLIAPIQSRQQLSRASYGSTPSPAASPSPYTGLFTPIFHFSGRFSSWTGHVVDTMAYVESPVPELDLRRPFAITAWARRGGIRVGAPVPAQSRCMLSLESGADQKTSLVSIGLAPGNGPICASLRPRRSDVDYSVLVKGSTAMPSYAIPRADWLLMMWVHVAMVRTETEVQLYVNGVHEESADLPPIDNRPNIRIVLGRGLHNGQMGHQWDGMVENVKVFQAALSPDDIVDEVRTSKPSLEGSAYLAQPFALP
ncbi:kinase-like protein [Exidia glandulosa HHB12029]|uniref:Kinase-like protein n=1 Tax=Exidia glandulosa HHB12029 TaxID=1314781 RepID=A0A165DPP6_EXIGL|nr:kinase-like protein [Exidia glandulosa HHB12029]